jgi:hypothetical protein
MIYLLKSPSWNPDYVKYKVGYTSDINRRIKQYDPETSLVATRPGDRIDEQNFSSADEITPRIDKDS